MRRNSHYEDAVAHVSDVNFKGEVMAVDQNKSDGPGFFAWFRRNDKAKNANNNTRDLFMNTILKLFDVESEQSLPQEVRTAMKLKDYGKGRPLTARRIRIVKNAIIDHVANNSALYKGAVNAADLRKQLGQAQTLSGIDDALLPGEENVAEGGNKENVAAFRNKICDDCMLMANGDWDMVTFNLDLKRKLEIKLPDGQRVSNDLDEARDQLAKFATGKDKYSELTEKEKTKVHVLMGILNQGVGHGLLFADGVARGRRRRTATPPRCRWASARTSRSKAMRRTSTAWPRSYRGPRSISRRTPGDHERDVLAEVHVGHQGPLPEGLPVLVRWALRGGRDI